MAKALVKEGVGVFCDIQLKNNCSVNDSIKYIVSSDGSEDEGERERERASRTSPCSWLARGWIKCQVVEFVYFSRSFFHRRKPLLGGVEIPEAGAS